MTYRELCQELQLQWETWDPEEHLRWSLTQQLVVSPESVHTGSLCTDQSPLAAAEGCYRCLSLKYLALAQKAEQAHNEQQFGGDSYAQH